MNTPAAVALDFDGVILQSNDIKTDAFRHLFAAWPQHLEEIVALHRQFGGISRLRKFDKIFAEILKEPLSPECRAEMGEEFTSFVFDAVLECPMIAGAEEFIRIWSKRCPLFVVSGTPHDELHEIVRRRSIGEYFTELHGSPREKPDILNDILARHGLTPEQMPYVGDAPSDERAARACGLRFIGVASDGVGPFESPDIVLKDLTGLGAALVT